MQTDREVGNATKQKAVPTCGIGYRSEEGAAGPPEHSVTLESEGGQSGGERARRLWVGEQPISLNAPRSIEDTHLTAACNINGKFLPNFPR